MNAVPEFYAQHADALAESYESLNFKDVHQDALSFLPTPPARVADIGAGSGRDAAALASYGYDVTATEPVPELRAAAQRLHARSAVNWIADALPNLPHLTGHFDLILLSAVWMHLDPSVRTQGMQRLHDLTAPDGHIVLSLRHGPPPNDRLMYDIPTAETIMLAERCGFTTVSQEGGPDRLGRPEVSWSELIMKKQQTA